MRLDLDELWAEDAPSPPWLIPRIMVGSQMVVLAGDAGTGKSLLALTWAAALASRQPIIGETQPEARTVLYINEENSWHDMREYVRWARYGLPEVDPILLKQHLLIEMFSLTVSHTGRWYDNLRTICGQAQPNLIVIDTATPACQIVDEDKNGEAGQAIGNLRRAMRDAAPGCGMLVLKHARNVEKGGPRSIRGAKAWKGATDGLIFHMKAAGRPRADGLHNTYLWPDKARAYGLKERLKITPQRLNWGTHKAGILLAYSSAPVED